MISWVSINHHDITREKTYERDRHTVHAVKSGEHSCEDHEGEPLQGLKNASMHPDKISKPNRSEEARRRMPRALP